MHAARRGQDGGPRWSSLATAGLLVASFLLLLAAPATAATGAPARLQPPLLERPLHVLPAAGAQATLPPTIQEGIGPGSAMLQHAKPGDAAGFLCTAAFLLRDPTTAHYYLATAGHCLVVDELDPTPYQGLKDPSKVNGEILVCVADCVMNALVLGTYLSFTPSEGYHPVLYAVSGGIGADFGVIDLGGMHHDKLRPDMPQWGGPTSYVPDPDGSFVVHYGHGTYCCPVVGGAASRTPADQGRAGILLSTGSDSWEASGWVTGGDSGSGVAIGEPDATGVLHGTQALGVLTHGLEGTGSLFDGTMMAHGLDLVRAATGLDLEVVLEGDSLTQTGTGPVAAPPVANLTIGSPAPGETVAGRSVRIQGQAGPDNLPQDAHVEVAVDDDAFGFDSRLVVDGLEAWQAEWDLGGVPNGEHVVRARLVAGNGSAVVQQEVRVLVGKVAAPPPSTAPTATSAGTTTGRPSKATTGATSSASSSEAEAPSLALPTAALALLALAVAVRRRAH